MNKLKISRIAEAILLVLTAPVWLPFFAAYFILVGFLSTADKIEKSAQKR